MERCPKRLEGCPKRFSPNGCRVVMHHIFWPSSAYRTPLEEEFRDLRINQVPMCEFEEQLLHQETTPPPKPTELVMEYVVEQEHLRQELAARPIHKL